MSSVCVGGRQTKPIQLGFMLLYTYFFSFKHASLWAENGTNTTSRRQYGDRYPPPHSHVHTCAAIWKPVSVFREIRAQRHFTHVKICWNWKSTAVNDKTRGGCCETTHPHSKSTHRPAASLPQAEGEGLRGAVACLHAELICSSKH